MSQWLKTGLPCSRPTATMCHQGIMNEDIGVENGNSLAGRDVGSNNGACGLHTGEGPGQAHRDQFERQGAAGSDRQAAKRCRRTDSNKSEVVSERRLKGINMLMMTGTLGLAMGVPGPARDRSWAVGRPFSGEGGRVGE